MKRASLIAFILLALAATAQAVPPRRTQAARAPAVAEVDLAPLPINDIYVIHFVLDGCNRKAFEQTLAKGKLPNIQRHFLQGGARFTHALSSFPSTSSSIYQSYTTGLLPGHAGIPHLERFDRQDEEVIGYLTPGGAPKINSDLINLRALLNPDVGELEPTTTIFELLRGYPTAALYTMFQRGASFVHPVKAPLHALWSTYVTDDVMNVDVLALQKVLDLFREEIQSIPRYALVGLYSADIMGHHYGPVSPEVEEVLVQFDLFLADFLVLLKERGIADKTFIIVSADHGMHESGDLFEFQKALEKRDVALKPASPRRRDYTLYAANRGVVSSHVYVRHDGGFEPLIDPEVLRKIPTTGGEPIDLIDAILKMEATDLVIVRAGERRAHVFRYDGTDATIACSAIGPVDYCSFSFDRTRGDPFGYAADPRLSHLLDGRPHSSFAWRQATAGEAYPDAVVQLSQIFHDGRAGDLFVTTRGRFGFRKVKAGNHGGPGEDDMRVPLLIAGPTVPRGAFGVARSVDLYPAMLQWFGIHVPAENHDGIDPFRDPPPEDGARSTLAALDLLFEAEPSLIKMIDVPGFVRRDVSAVASLKAFPHLLTPAREEAARRSRILANLRALLKQMEAQRTEEDAPRVVDDPAYLADHIAIVEREIGRASASVRRMEEIEMVLKKCGNPNASGCRAL